MQTARVGVPIAEKAIVAEPAKSADAEVLQAAPRPGGSFSAQFFNPDADLTRRKTLQPFSKFCGLKSN